MDLRESALQALCTADPREKAALAHALHAVAATLPIASTMPLADAAVPGRPDRPALVHPSKVPRRSPSKPEGLAALLHAIAHIEFNAIKNASNAAESHQMNLNLA